MYINKLHISAFMIFLMSTHLFSDQKDSIYTINSLSNTLYLGIDNYIHIPDLYLNDTLYYFISDNGIIYKDSIYFNIVPVRLPDVNIIFYKKNDEDTVIVCKKRFFVKYVPKPCILLCNQCLEEIKFINRNKLLKNPVLSIHVSDDIIGAQQWMRIKRFSLGYVFGSVYKSYEAEGNILTDEMKNIISQLRPGQQINIHISIESQDNLIRYLPVYTLTIF